ncbi:hypothetical protein I6J18_07260 [Peribacillus psychrosaccharolyticus]|uniref:Uncharacterized protein n=1 Tax=Peribacillus psychrosaccharolyticus TaxID=1407 RepID=A0A974NPZ0_PERPY|nr:hypothetical protein [Peribacillus psychrosaccharolyticus]MEC2053674.1 hypothetical protein [Peribacillus psychrosaccharolyticus]MED3742711.1 hypothetical protein [Peribacillus psychrosaccharolyticus]QQT01650.1 hypothetical protein I6J18_07260 [Peribacillus psychrosaccharolyticus]
MKYPLYSLSALMLVSSYLYVNENVSKSRALMPIPSTEVLSAMTQVRDDFQVGFSTKGTSVFVDCYTREYSFTPNSEKPLASVLVYVDGAKVDEMRTAAFIVKDLPQGKHRIKVKLIDEQKQTTYTKEFSVHIQSSL